MVTTMSALSTMLSGAVAAPSPLPHRPPRRDGDMPWEEAIDRHRHRLALERESRLRAWTGASLDAALADATRQLVEVQAALLDWPDEGRLGEDEAVRALGRLFDGIELETGLEEPLEWVPEAAPPRLVEPPRLIDDRSLERRWERAQTATSKPVKLSILGPRSAAGLIDDAVHGVDVDAGARALAEALNPGLEALGEAGCPLIELVEPALLMATPRVTADGFEAIARALHKVPRATRRWLRLVPADAREPWLGAAPPALNLRSIASVLEDLPIDGVVLEPAAVLADIQVLEQWRRLQVALLVVPADADASFRPDDAVGALAEAGARLEPRRLLAAIDGGGARARRPLRERLAMLETVAAALR